MSKIEEYLSQDIDNPKYLFHGSPKKMEIIKPNLSHDSDNNEVNIAEAIFLFPSFLKATPYSFKDTIKANSFGLHWNFEIPNTNELPLMIMSNVNTYENIIGYVYVFEKDKTMVKDPMSYQYKCFHDLVPIDVVEVHYNDYKEFFTIVNSL